MKIANKDKIQDDMIEQRWSTKFITGSPIKVPWASYILASHFFSQFLGRLVCLGLFGPKGSRNGLDVIRA